MFEWVICLDLCFGIHVIIFIHIAICIGRPKPKLPGRNQEPTRNKVPGFEIFDLPVSWFGSYLPG